MNFYKVVLFFGIVLSGCYSPYQRTYLNNTHAKRFLACPSDGIENPLEHSFLAIQSTLADANWVIKQIETSKFHITAKICINVKGYSADFLKRKDIGCATVKFMVRENADIFAVIPEDESVDLSMIDWLRYKMRKVERIYAELRCYSAEVLRERAAGKVINK